MKKALLVFPHFDDAVLSAGQFMAGRPDCDVVTVFAGEPKDWDKQTPYDAKCGFAHAKDAVAVRSQEDNRALAILQANPIHLEFVDSQYKEFSSIASIANAVNNIILEGDYEMVIFPLGIIHPDHFTVAQVGMYLYQKKALGGLDVYFAEDLPNRVIHPDKVVERLKELKLSSDTDFIGDGEMALKIRALWCYKSQMNTGDLDPYLLYVPERFHKL